MIASFLVVLSTLIFLSLGGHLFLIELLLQSFSAIPIGGGDIDFTASIWNLTIWSSMAFLGAVLIALPVMLIMMLINLCIGVVTRAAPALNIFAVGFPAMLLGGLILIVIFMANFGSRIQWLWLEAFDVAQNLWVSKMAEGQEDTQEKTEEPTAKRLLKAREEGQLARSQETTIAASVIALRHLYTCLVSPCLRVFQMTSRLVLFLTQEH